MCSGRARLTLQSPQHGLSSPPLTLMSNDTCSFHYSVEWKVLVTKVHRDGLGSSHPSKVFFYQIISVQLDHLIILWELWIGGTFSYGEKTLGKMSSFLLLDFTFRLTRFNYFVSNAVIQELMSGSHFATKSKGRKIILCMRIFFLHLDFFGN